MTTSLIAVDIGNSRIKLGRFRPEDDAPLPEPQATLELSSDAAQWPALGPRLADRAQGGLSWWIGSVNRPAAARLLDWLCAQRPDERVTLLAAGDVPLEVRLDRPDMVGVDRLLDAAAANRLRQPGRAAVVVDVGSAVTVDLVSPDGAFCGGAILPGIAMSARALHQFTDLLPLLEMAELGEPPPALGTATISALRSGLFWGAVGAIRELIGQMAKPFAQAPQVFLTGGAGPAVAELLGRDARHVPHLTLAGIVLAARKA